MSTAYAIYRSIVDPEAYAKMEAHEEWLIPMHVPDEYSIGDIIMYYEGKGDAATGMVCIKQVAEIVSCNDVHHQGLAARLVCPSSDQETIILGVMGRTTLPVRAMVDGRPSERVIGLHHVSVDAASFQHIAAGDTITPVLDGLYVEAGDFIEFKEMQGDPPLHSERVCLRMVEWVRPVCAPETGHSVTAMRLVQLTPEDEASVRSGAWSDKKEADRG